MIHQRFLLHNVPFYVLIHAYTSLTNCFTNLCNLRNNKITSMHPVSNHTGTLIVGLNPSREYILPPFSHRRPEPKAHLRNPSVDGRITLGCILKTQSMRACSGCIWPRIWARGSLVCTPRS
jgi:hypothetical protein